MMKQLNLILILIATVIAIPTSIAFAAEILGTDGNDVEENALVGTIEDDSISGFDGDDEASGGDGNDQITGNAGNDFGVGDAGDDQLHGNSGQDQLFGGVGNDVLHGNIGIDVLDGGVGDDLIRGEGDNDFLFGDKGKDNLIGGNGNDFLDGGDGDDLLLGGPGDDTLFGGIGIDEFDGGPGFDTCLIDPNEDLIWSNCEVTIDVNTGEPFVAPEPEPEPEPGPGPITNSFEEQITGIETVIIEINSLVDDKTISKKDGQQTTKELSKAIGELEINNSSGACEHLSNFNDLAGPLGLTSQIDQINIIKSEIGCTA